MKERGFPKFDYYLDESDPDIVLLRRQDGAFVAAFSSQGATREGIQQAAIEDYRALLHEYVPSPSDASSSWPPPRGSSSRGEGSR